jgi:mono/diheme cytochrome c family protein
VSRLLAIDELPEADPGLPRFLGVVVLVALLAAAYVVARPGGNLPAPDLAGASAAATSSAPLSGADLFLREGCGECHVTVGPSTALGPSLAGALEHARARLEQPSYTGSATSPEAYLREATLDHCKDLLPGYQCPEVLTVGLRLSTQELDRLVAYVAGLPGGSP